MKKRLGGRAPERESSASPIPPSSPSSQWHRALTILCVTVDLLILPDLEDKEAKMAANGAEVVSAFTNSSRYGKVVWTVKNFGHGLRELDPRGRGSQDAGSHILGTAFFTIPVTHCATYQMA